MVGVLTRRYATSKLKNLRTTKVVRGFIINECFMITDHVYANVIDELFHERIVPYLGMAETQMALKETELVYKRLCVHEPAKEHLSLLYERFLSTYECIRRPDSKQAVLDCIHFLNTEVRRNPALF